MRTCWDDQPCSYERDPLFVEQTGTEVSDIPEEFQVPMEMTAKGIPTHNRFPRDLAFDNDGVLYLIDSTRVRIVKTQLGDNGWSPWTFHRKEWSWAQPYGIDIGEDGRLYVADMGGDKVLWDLDPAAGGGVHSHGSYGKGKEQLRYPRDIAVGPGPDELIYVADSHNNRVVILNGCDSSPGLEGLMPVPVPAPVPENTGVPNLSCDRGTGSWITPS